MPQAATEVRSVTEFRVHPGPQQAALASDADIVIFGGAKGGGKSWALLLAIIQYAQVPEFSAVIFRRTYGQLTMPGGLWPESFRLFPSVGGVVNLADFRWTFPSGATALFSHMEHPMDRFRWDGAQIPMIGWDQLESFSEEQFWYLPSCNRAPRGGVRPWMFATCNPVPDTDGTGGWLHRLVQWWIDPASGRAIPERSGETRWVIRRDDVLHWADSRPGLVARHPERTPGGALIYEPKSITFIASQLEDNPTLTRNDPGYLSRIMLMPFVERERLLGNWNIRPTAGSVFNRGWFAIVDAAPGDARRIRSWDKACLVAGTVIETVRGSIPIERVRPGDLVLTRRGFRRVLRAWATGWRPVIRLGLTNGQALIGTSDHRIWTEQRGWVPISAVLEGDYGLYLQVWGTGSNQTRTLLSLRACGTPEDQGSGTTKPSVGESETIHSIVRSGALDMDRSRRDTSSTTWMETGTTTALRTSSASRRDSMSRRTWPHGTPPERGASLSGSSRSRCAIDVEPRDIGGGSENKCGPITRRPVENNAGEISRAESTGKGLRSSAGTIGAGGSFGSAAAARGATEVELAEGDFIAPAAPMPFGESENWSERVVALVYDLEIEGAHEFFANGVLVHNSTEGGGAYSAGVKMARASGTYYVEDVVRGQWSPHQRNLVMRQVAEADGPEVAIHMEQEPGSGGKESALLSIRELAGYSVHAETVTGDKVTRAQGLSAQAEAGNVKLVRGEWNEAYLSELHGFPEGKYKDQIDSSSAAFNKLALSSGAPSISVLGQSAPVAPRRVFLRG